MSDFPEEIPVAPRNGARRAGPSLARTSKQGAKLPDRIILYGVPGWGKTTFAAGMPEPIFLMTPGEDRLKKLIANGLLPPTGYFDDVAETWNDVNLAVNELIVQPHDYKTFVLDTGNGAERLAQEDVCNNEFNGDWGEQGFNAFGRGEKITANKLWARFLMDLDRLRERRGMRIVLCCHANVRNTKNPDGPDYDKIEPAVSKPSWAYTAKWADMILYGSVELQAKKESKLAKAKVTGGEVRILHTTPRASYEAKNCHGLPSVIRLGSDPRRSFAAFREAFPKKPAPKPVEATPTPQASQSPTAEPATNGAAT